MEKHLSFKYDKMKRNSFTFQAIAYFLIMIAFTSCSKIEPLEIIPVKTTIEAITYNGQAVANCLDEYIEIIESNYLLTPINDEKDLQIDIKVRSLKTTGNDVNIVVSGIGLHLVDDVGTIIEEWGGVGEFDLVNEDVLSDYLKSGGEDCLLRFENSTYPFEEILKTPQKIAGFIVKASSSIPVEKTELSNINVSASNNSALINKYEQLLNKYIALDKKLDELNTSSKKWDTTYDEYDEVEDQLFDLEEEIWVLDDDDKLSSQELARFERLVEKFEDY